MTNLLTPNTADLMESALDITQPTMGVEVLVDQRRGVVWVNVDGVCTLRVCKIPGEIQVRTL